MSVQSDHYAVIFALSIIKPKREIKTITARKWKALDTVSMSSDIQSMLLQHFPNDAEDAATKYNKFLSELLDKYAPSKQCDIVIRHNTPWFNQDIKAAKVLRRKIEKKYRTLGLLVDLSQYRQQRNIVNALVEVSKQTYYMDQISAASDQKQLQKVFDKLLHNDHKISPLPTIYKGPELAEKFADFFCNKISSIRDSITSTITANETSDLQPSIPDPLMHFQSISDSDTLKLLQKSASKSCNLDPIPTWLLKDMKDDITPILTRLVNQSLSSGCFPSAFKEAIVTPLLKKPTSDAECLKNYRPVSNLAFASKLTERAVAMQYVEHCRRNNLRNDFQAAYKAHNSTETAMTRVHNDILHAVDEKGAAILVLLDLSAAFDTLDHTLLLQSLAHNIGVSGTALKWFTSYLSCRSQAVSVKGSVSTKRSLSCGVPQGSVLGPILFTTYTRPLGKIISDAGLCHMFYADDTQLYLSFRPNDVESVQDAVNKVSSCVSVIKTWMNNHFLKLNEDKTEVLVVSTPYVSKSLSIPTLMLDGVDISTSGKVRDLGVTLDSAMQYHHHVNSVVRNAYYQLNRIARIRNYLTEEATKSLIHALVISRLDYCNALYYGLPGNLVTKLQRVQNHAARLVRRLHKFDHVTPVLMSLHWLPIEQRVKFKILVLTFKAVRGLAPKYISDLIKPYVPTRSLRSSSKHLLEEPCYKLETYGARSFRCAAPRLWNGLSQTLRDARSLPAFKRMLKTILFKSAYGE